MTLQTDLLLKRVELLKTIPNDFKFLHLFPTEFNKNITVISGENGMGKSTLLEALAVKMGCPAEGGSVNFHYSTEDTHLDYTKHLRVSKTGKRIQDIFFYRAETFYTFLSEMRKLDSEYSFDPHIKSYYGGGDLHTVSHGESMRALFKYRFKPNGLYILDEPEASLSISSQIDFIEKIQILSKDGAQFIIATHSPILMLMPNIELFQVSNNSICEICFKDTNMYYLYNEILKSKGEFINNIISI